MAPTDLPRVIAYFSNMLLLVTGIAMLAIGRSLPGGAPIGLAGRLRCIAATLVSVVWLGFTVAVDLGASDTVAVARHLVIAGLFLFWGLVLWRADDLARRLADWD